MRCTTALFLERVFGNTEDAVVLCPKCGAVVPVDPWIRAKGQGGFPKLVSRLGTLQKVPAHTRRGFLSV